MNTSKAKAQFEAVVRLCTTRGFVFPSSEIYGGLSAIYDYGPLGTLLLRNIRTVWTRELVQKSRNVVAMDGAILAHPKIWEASGHVDRFSDPVVTDQITGTVYRADHLVKEVLSRDVSDLSMQDLQKLIEEHNIQSPTGNPISSVSPANLLVHAQVGGRDLYLRGETCQNIFVDYLQLARTTGSAIPFGVLQIGKVFRNEVSGRQFILRMREFEQMEFEFFIDPSDSTPWYETWKTRFVDLLADHFHISRADLRYREAHENERPHYAQLAADLEYRLDDDEWLELSPMNHRGDWDLRRHMEFSGKDLTAFDPATKRSFIPHIIETSFGTSRLMYVLLYQALREERIPDSDETRTVLKLPRELAPFQAAILPLSKKEQLRPLANALFDSVAAEFSCDFDDSASIGKRYRRQDEIGTPFCITVDFDSEADTSVTIRDRDTMQQERIAVERVNQYLRDHMR